MSVFRDPESIDFRVRKHDLDLVRVFNVHRGDVAAVARARKQTPRSFMFDLTGSVNTMLRSFVRPPYLFDAGDDLVKIMYVLYFCCSHDSYQAAIASFVGLQNASGQTTGVTCLLERMINLHIDVVAASAADARARAAIRSMWRLIEVAAWTAYVQGHDMHGMSPMAYARARRHFGDEDFWRAVKAVDPQLCRDIVRIQQVAKTLQREATQKLEGLDTSFVSEYDHGLVFRLWLAAYDHLDDMRAWNLVAARANVRDEFLQHTYLPADERQLAPWRANLRDREIALVGGILQEAKELREQAMAKILERFDIPKPKSKPKCKPVRLPVPQPDDDAECIICCSNDANVSFKCGHTCLCAPCAGRWRAKSNTCPMCRRPL